MDFISTLLVANDGGGAAAASAILIYCRDTFLCTYD